MPHRNRQADLLVLSNHVLHSLSVTVAPADTYLRFTINGVEEVLAVLDCPWNEDLEDYTKEQRAYARSLLEDLGDFLVSSNIKVDFVDSVGDGI